MKNKIISHFTFCFLLFVTNANCQWITVCNTGNGFVDNFENFNGELYATGFFNTICGTSCNYVAKYNGNTWQSVGNGFPNSGHYLSTIDSILYGVAYQPNIDSNWLYQFDGTNFNKFGEGTYLTTAVTGFSQTNNLYKIIKYDSSIIVSGEFDRVGSKRISGVMKWSGTQWDSLGSGISGHNTLSTYPYPIMYPHDMCIFNNDLIIGGEFEFAGGQIARSVARWDGTAWHPMGQGFNEAVYGLCVYNGELYAGGDFTMSGTTPLTYIAKWDGTNWVAPGFSLFYINPNNYTFIHTLKVLYNKLIISGGFDRAVIGTDTLQCQAVVAYDGATIDTLRGGIVGNEAEAVAGYSGLLFAGGGPTNTQSYIASYDLSSAVQEIHNRATVNVFPNPTTSEIQITCDKTINEINVNNIVGQIIYTAKPKEKNTSFKLDINGIYFVTISSDKQTTTRKIIVTNNKQQ